MENIDNLIQSYESTSQRELSKLIKEGLVLNESQINDLIRLKKASPLQNAAYAGHVFTDEQLEAMLESGFSGIGSVFEAAYLKGLDVKQGHLDRLIELDEDSCYGAVGKAFQTGFPPDQADIDTLISRNSFMASSAVTGAVINKFMLSSLQFDRLIAQDFASSLHCVRMTIEYGFVPSDEQVDAIWNCSDASKFRCLEALFVSVRLPDESEFDQLLLANCSESRRALKKSIEKGYVPNDMQKEIVIRQLDQ